jgi:hypothetical protein
VKPIVLPLAALAGMCLVLAATGQAQAPVPAAAVDLAADVREAKVREAALRSVAGSLAVLEEGLPPPAVLAETMLADPAAFADPEAARARLADRERDSLRTAFREQLEAFARGRDEQLPPAWVDEVLREEAARIDATIHALVGETFVERFRDVRAAAVAMQRDRIAPQLYPPAADLLKLAGDPAAFAAAPNGRPAELARTDAAQSLATAATARVRAETRLFAEIDATLDRAAGDAVAAGLGELWRQLGAVERLAPAGAVREVDIASALRADLESMARTSQLPYGVFPEVEARVDARAAELERRQLAEHVGDRLSPQTGCPALPAQTVIDSAGSDFATMPVAFEEHAAALRDRLAPQAKQQIVASHAAAVADADRAAFAQRIAGLFEEDETLRRRWAGALAACLEPPLREHRERLAATELQSRLPAIADLSFEIGDDDLASLAVSEDEVDPTLFPPAGELHLDETKALFVMRAEALQREARAAVRLQELLTRAPDRRQRFVREVEADDTRTSERKQHYQKAYETEVLEAWKERGKRILLRSESGETIHPGKYARIFPTTTEIIDEIITIEFGRPAPTVTRAPPPPSPVPTRPPTQAPTPVSPRPTTKIERSGPLPTPQDAGLPAKSQRPLPLPQTGGAPKVGPGAGTGGPKSCEERLQSSLRATGLCYDALVACRDDPASCAEGLARCGQAKFACEQPK